MGPGGACTVYFSVPQGWSFSGASIEYMRTAIGPELSWTLIVSPSVTLRTVPTSTGTDSSAYGCGGVKTNGGRGAREAAGGGAASPAGGGTGAAAQPASNAAMIAPAASLAAVAGLARAVCGADVGTVSRCAACMVAQSATRGRRAAASPLTIGPTLLLRPCAQRDRP